MGEVSKRSADLLRFLRLSEAEGLSFLKKGGVTYVTRKAKQQPDPFILAVTEKKW
jgi:hypothetical protein